MLTIDTLPVYLPDRLKQATQDLHAALERSLGLLVPPIDRSRLITLLERFHGFHAAWEPAVGGLLADEDFLSPRRRAALAEADLAALGRPGAVIATLPRCEEAGRLADRGEAWGSLYVMEGSTLGGRLISRHLSQEDWMPPGGMRYFDPYGDLAGARWRETRERLASLADDAHDRAVAGARLTFQRLHDWLRPAFRR